jgi:hypothetical protein
MLRKKAEKWPFCYRSAQQRGATAHTVMNAHIPSPNNPLPNPAKRLRGIDVPTTIWLAPHHSGNGIVAGNPADAGVIPGWLAERIAAEYLTGPGHVAFFTPENGPVPVIAPLPAPAPGHVTDEPENPAEQSRPSRPSPGPITLAIASTSPAPTPRHTSRQYPGQAQNVSPDAFLTTIVTSAHRHLADGAILAVVTTQPTPGVGFTDPTGPVIRAGRAAGFAYLQHIVALTVPAHEDHFTAPTAPAHRALTDPSALPVHTRIHLDLVILQRTGKARNHG